MESRKQRFDATHDVLPVIEDGVLQKVLGNAFGLFGVHIFTPSADIPDDGQLRAVVLPIQHGHEQRPQSSQEEAAKMPEQRGDQPRLRQNRLLFIAPDQNNIDRLQDQVRTLLAWQSIVSDYKNTAIVLDNLMARNAEESLSAARDVLKRSVQDTLRYMMVPLLACSKDGRPSDVRLLETRKLAGNAPA